MKVFLTISFTLLSILNCAQTVLWDSTFVVQNNTFKVQQLRDDSGHSARIVQNKIDTTFIDGTVGIDIIYFNDDDSPDLQFSFISNTPLKQLFLYDTLLNRYQKVKSFPRFPEAKAIASNSSYYYSYQSAGCADLNWVSYLFYIEDFEVIEIGEIMAIGCEGNNDEKGIKTYKIVTLDKVLLMDELPIETIDHYENYKWGFIEEYWNSNFGKFKNPQTP